MHLASKNNRANVVALLLHDYKAEVNARGRWGYTPLHYAASYNSPECAELLIANGADLEAVTETGLTALEMTTNNLRPKSSTILGLLLQSGASLDLHCAIRLGMTEIVRYMIHNDANLIKGIRRADDLLYEATLAGKKELVELLVNHGAPINPTQGIGIPPLIAAIDNGLTEIAEFLLEHGANVDSRVHGTNRTPFQAASELGNKKIFDLLRKKEGGV